MIKLLCRKTGACFRRGPGFLFFLFLTSLTGTVSAEETRVEFVRTEPVDGTEYEIFAAEVTDPADLERTSVFVVSDLVRTLAQNPDVRPEILRAVGGDLQTAYDKEVELFTSRLKEIDPRASLVERILPAEFLDWYRENYSLTLTLIRGVSNGTTASWNVVIAEGIPWAATLAVGTFTAIFSGLCQYFNHRLMDFVTATRNWHRVLRTEENDSWLRRQIDQIPKLSRKVKGFFKSVFQTKHAVDQGVPIGKWGGFEFAFLSAIGLMSELSVRFHNLGASFTERASSLASEIGDGPLDFLMSRTGDLFLTYGQEMLPALLPAVAIGMIAQAPWDTSIGKAKFDRIRVDPTDPERVRESIMIQNTQTALISIISVAGTVAVYKGLPYAAAGLIGLSGAGIANWIRVAAKNPKTRAVLTALLTITGTGLTLANVIPQEIGAAGLLGFLGGSAYQWVKGWFARRRCEGALSGPASANPAPRSEPESQSNESQ